MLNNENVRAVGNMNVNARGDSLDSTNRVIEPKNRQVQKQYSRQARGSTLSTDTVITSTKAAAEKRKALEKSDRVKTLKKEQDAPVQADDEIAPEVTQPAPVDVQTEESKSRPTGGLAAAIAKSREIKQEQMKTARQRAQEQQGVKKI